MNKTEKKLGVKFDRGQIIFWGGSGGVCLLALMLILYMMGDPLGIYASVGIRVEQPVFQTTDCTLRENRSNPVCIRRRTRERKDAEWNLMQKSRKKVTPFNLD